MVQVEGSDTWLTQEEYEQMCKERDAYKAAEQAEEQSYYNAILQSTETPVPTTTAAIICDAVSTTSTTIQPA